MEEEDFNLFINTGELYPEETPEEAQPADVSTAINPAPQDNSAATGSNLHQPSRSSSEGTLPPAFWSPPQQTKQESPPTPFADDWENLQWMYSCLDDVPLDGTFTGLPASTTMMQQPSGAGLLNEAPYYPAPFSFPAAANGAGFAPTLTHSPQLLPAYLPAVDFTPQWQQQQQQQQQQPPPPSSSSPPPPVTAAAIAAPKPKRQRQRRENRHAAINTHQGAGGMTTAFAVQTTDSMHKTLAEDGNQTERYNGFQPTPRFGADGRCTRGMKRKRGCVGEIGADDNDKDDK
ncbi:MAG: hypothetical protein LQ351_006060 [Letrouitia transgressa]|nr:MAG: hypothetical protein LQ351_006060 [Letrouitia transgressa]